VRGDAALPKARGGSADGCGHAFASLGCWGDGGTLAGKRPPHEPRSDHNKTRHRPARPRSKRRRGGATPAPFCCPSPQVMEFDFDLCGGIYLKGARHKGLLCEPEGRELLPARALCIRRLYVKHRHTHNRRSRQRLNGTAWGRGSFRLPLHQQPANRKHLARFFREVRSGEAAAGTERAHLDRS
jgi:hypothetical protein